MLAACSNWPARSSSTPCPIACALAGPRARSSSVSVTNHAEPRRMTRGAGSPADSSRRRSIQLSEVLEHQTALLGRQHLQLFPRRIPQAGAGPRPARLENVGKVDAVARGRAADSVLGLVGLVVRQRATGIEQPMVQALLALDGLLIEPSGFELAGQLLGLLRERAGGGARPFRLEPPQLLPEGNLPAAQAAEP